MRTLFGRGFRDGLPISVAYLSVSFSVGIAAVKAGIPTVGAILMSLTNLTSAGEAAGIDVIAAGGTLIEMVVCQLIINLRYALMGVSLSQNLAPSFTTGHRLAVSYGITDEIFAVAITRVEPLTPSYMYGLILGPMLGWTVGTGLGAAAGSLLPPVVTSAMGILLYGMFIGIILPPARKDRHILAVILMAAVFRSVFYYFVPGLTSGFAVCISAVAASVLGALLFPGKDAEVTA